MKTIIFIVFFVSINSFAASSNDDEFIDTMKFSSDKCPLFDQVETVGGGQKELVAIYMRFGVGLKEGGVEKSQRWIEQGLSSVALEIHQRIPYPSCYSSKIEHQRAVEALVVLAVLYDQGYFSGWKSDKELLSIFNEIKIQEKETYSEFSKHDWGGSVSNWD